MRILSRLQLWALQHLEKLVTQRIATLEAANIQTDQSTHHFRWIKSVFAVILILLFSKACNKENPQPQIPKNKIVIHSPFRIKNQVSPYVPPEGHITITPKHKGDNINDLIKVHYQKLGFSHELGLQTSMFEKSLGLDCKVFYMERFGLNLGLLASPDFPLYVSPTATVSYRLDRLLPFTHNTEVWAGLVPLSRFTYQAGIRVNL